MAGKKRKTEPTVIETGSWAADITPTAHSNTYVHTTPHACAAMQIRRLREAKRWNQQQLADRLDELGLHVDRTTIAKIETSSRAITVDELLAFAIALDVAPPHLLTPPDGGQIFVAPEVFLTANQAREWLTGLRPIGAVQDAGAFTAVIPEPDLPMKYRNLLHIQKVVGFALAYARRGDDAKTEQALDALQNEMDRRRDVLALADLENEDDQ